jgi:2-amino-4-hydroxy-6-hydroxymethyldihydropteridine diphosphokinase
VSSVYRSDPVGYLDQPDFWNLALRLATSLGPERLMERARRIEDGLGRERTFRNAPRTLDIDLLLYDDVVLSGPLVVPHPRLRQRAFALRPLVELDPGLRHPLTGERLADLALAPGLERLEPLFPGTRLLPDPNPTGS